MASETQPLQHSFARAATNVGKVLLPILGKAVVSIATANTVTGADVAHIGKAVSDAAAAATEQAIEARLSSFEKDQASFRAFVESLTQFAAKVHETTACPFVIFIDELDRCSTTFAVRLLERLKHFFSVPHLSFVLLIDRRQLENAVKGEYGESIDTDAYLRKFIHLNLSLPRRSRPQPGTPTEVQRYIRYLGRKVKLQGSTGPKRLGDFISVLAEFSPAFGMSFRDVERCFVEFVVAMGAESSLSETLIGPLAFLISLRVANNSLYSGIMRRDPDALDHLKTISTDLTSHDLSQEYDQMLVRMCECYIFGLDRTEDQSLHQICVRCGFVYPSRMVPLLVALIEAAPS